MTSRLWLLVLLCSVSHVLSQRYLGHDSMEEDWGDDAKHGWGDGGWGHGGKDGNDMEGYEGESQLCTTHFNVQENVTSYPDCLDPTTCPMKNCWWWAWWSCAKDSCCDRQVSTLKIESRNRTVCCPGYTEGKWGRCNKPLCSSACEDLTTTCVAPNTCGPACYPPCRNGGTCQAGSPANTCSCALGWTGPICDMAVQCNATGDDACQNGGSCNSGSCLCAEGYSGPLCNKVICTGDCLNGGMCSTPDTCQCVNGFTGDNCEVAPAEATA